MCSGLLVLQMPGAAPASEVTIHIMRCKGALLIGEAITSLQAPGFLHSRDKRALFSSRIIVSFIVLIIYTVGHKKCATLFWTITPTFLDGFQHYVHQ